MWYRQQEMLTRGVSEPLESGVLRRRGAGTAIIDAKLHCIIDPLFGALLPVLSYICWPSGGVSGLHLYRVGGNPAGGANGNCFDVRSSTDAG